MTAYLNIKHKLSLLDNLRGTILNKSNHAVIIFCKIISKDKSRFNVFCIFLRNIIKIWKL